MRLNILNKLVSRINDRGPWIILTPWVASIGNSSEEILFGLIRARREGKKLVVLRPYELFGKFRFPVTNREIFDVASPHRADPPALLVVAAQLGLTALYGFTTALSRLLVKLFGPAWMLPVSVRSPTLGATTLWQPVEEPAGFDWDAVARYRWPEEVLKPLAVDLRPPKLARARAKRLEMGLPEDAWYAAIHVREGGFHRDHAASVSRNASIANFIPAIREITARGGWVVRLGDSTMTPLPPLERVIDYPHTACKSDLMDIYLVSRCRLYIGMSSGILDTALLFQRPMLLTNLPNMTFIYPRRPGDRGLPKHVRSRSLGRFLSARELLEAPWDAQHFDGVGSDYEFFENTPAEIRDAAVEFLDGLESGSVAPTPLQAQAGRLRIAQGRRILGQPLFGDRDYDLFTRYRIASRLESSAGALSQSYLEKNWERSAMERTAGGKPA